MAHVRVRVCVITRALQARNEQAKFKEQLEETLQREEELRGGLEEAERRAEAAQRRAEAAEGSVAALRKRQEELEVGCVLQVWQWGVCVCVASVAVRRAGVRSKRVGGRTVEGTERGPSWGEGRGEG